MPRNQYSDQTYLKLDIDNRDIMENRLQSKIKEAIDEFTTQSNQITDGYREVAGREGRRTRVNQTIIKNALKNFCPKGESKAITGDLITHYENLEKLIPFCSSPRSFRSAWDLRSDVLNKLDADILVNQGAQIIPANKKERLFQAVQQGVELGENKRLISFVRHSAGNYDDKLNDALQFTYQPPNDATGMLRYRWSQYLSKKLEVPLMLIAVMWFSFRVNDSINQVFVAAPVKIIDFDRDLQNLDDSLHEPLTLQIVNRADAYNFLNIIYSLNETSFEIKTRPELPRALAIEWAFDKINSSKKGRQIKKFASRMGKSCPGSLCNHKKFEQLTSQNIAFGHIISQRWIRSFNFLLDKKDHPDNLYLSCQRCNASLSDNFPDTELRNEIETRGTIGDWLRGHVESIREQ